MHYSPKNTECNLKIWEIKPEVIFQVYQIKESDDKEQKLNEKNNNLIMNSLSYPFPKKKKIKREEEKIIPSKTYPQGSKKTIHVCASRLADTVAAFFAAQKCDRVPCASALLPWEISHCHFQGQLYYAQSSPSKPIS